VEEISMDSQYFPIIGATCFGAVVGWMANHVLERATQVDIKWLGSMVGVLGGGAITALFPQASQMFAGYCIGLAGAFFLRVFFLPVARWVGAIFVQEAAREVDKPRSHTGNAKQSASSDHPKAGGP
jgi:hypothetical protein